MGVGGGMGGGGGGGGGAGPGTLLGTEVCAALLLLCWLCCWPDDASDTSSSRKHPRKPIIVESGSHRRTSEFFSRHFGSSAVSLHLPSTSGHANQPLSAHRSHEEIRSRRKSHHEPTVTETRYHSAPSVIDEVIHRRDWERSTKDLYIPLKSEAECAMSVKSNSSSSQEQAPCAEPESSSIECLKPEESIKKCKKHHTNIKSSKRKFKESNKDDIKDTDATETDEAGVSHFYIGETREEASLLNKSPVHYEELLENERRVEERNSMYHAKNAKQSLNESIRLKELPRKSLLPVEEGEVSRSYEFGFDDVIDVIDGIDRSGAVHHTIESRLSCSRPYPPPSVETVGYEGGACYLAEVGSMSELRARAYAEAEAGAEAEAVATAGAGAGSWRARHASDGDILAPPQRPESGAFSESDLDLELEGLALQEAEERPPPYHELQLYASPQKKETAI